MNPILANIVLEFFLKGGPVMWPILISAIVAVAVVGERAFWWWREGGQRERDGGERRPRAPRLSHLAERVDDRAARRHSITSGAERARQAKSTSPIVSGSTSR